METHNKTFVGIGIDLGKVINIAVAVSDNAEDDIEIMCASAIEADEISAFIESVIYYYRDTDSKIRIVLDTDKFKETNSLQNDLIKSEITVIDAALINDEAKAKFTKQASEFFKDMENDHELLAATYAVAGVYSPTVRDL